MMRRHITQDICSFFFSQVQTRKRERQWSLSGLPINLSLLSALLRWGCGYTQTVTGDNVIRINNNNALSQLVQKKGNKQLFSKQTTILKRGVLSHLACNDLLAIFIHTRFALHSCTKLAMMKCCERVNLHYPLKYKEICDKKIMSHIYTSCVYSLKNMPLISTDQLLFQAAKVCSKWRKCR